MTIPYTAIANAVDKGLFIVINNGRSLYRGEYDKTVVKPTEKGYKSPLGEATSFIPAELEEKDPFSFVNGERVESINDAFKDGETYFGHVINNDGQNANVRWDDGDESEISVDSIKVSSNGQVTEVATIITEKETQEIGFVVGQIVQSNSNFEYGAGYEGTVDAVEQCDDGSWRVAIKWEDGDENTIPTTQVDAE